MGLHHPIFHTILYLPPLHAGRGHLRDGSWGGSSLVPQAELVGWVGGCVQLMKEGSFQGDSGEEGNHLGDRAVPFGLAVTL